MTAADSATEVGSGMVVLVGSADRPRQGSPRDQNLSVEGQLQLSSSHPVLPESRSWSR